MNGHHHFFHFFSNRELNELYISMAIRIFALSMVNIFVPIYLLNLGFSLTSVLLFYITFNLTHAACVIPAAKIAARFGFKHAILFSVPLLIIVYLALYTIEIFNWPLLLIAIILGINNALFWLGYHVDFCKFTDGKKRARQIGFAHIVIKAVHVIGPVIGGIILSVMGFNALFTAVAVLLLASTIPLFLSKDIHEPLDFSLKDTFRKQKVRDYLGFAGYGIEAGIGLVIWPIFIFFYILNSYTTLGLVSSASMLFSLLFILIISKLADKNRRAVLRIGAIANTVLWGLRAFVTTTFQVFVVDSFYGITRSAIQVPFTALSYDKAYKSNIVQFTIFREICINFFKALMFIVLIFISDIIFSFFLGGGGSLLMLLF